jgi:hypothetical protein
LKCWNKKIRSLKESGKQVAAVQKVAFFGAGCGSMEGKRRMMNVLHKTVFPEAAIEVENDLMAAALATCGKESGIVCILGTGSNCCSLTAGRFIPGILDGATSGDERVAAWYGKIFFAVFFYMNCPTTSCKNFPEPFTSTSTRLLKRFTRDRGPMYFLPHSCHLSSRKNPIIREGVFAGRPKAFLRHTCVAFNQSERMCILSDRSLISLKEE